MKTREKEMVQEGLVDLLNKIRQGHLTNPLGIKIIITNVLLAFDDRISFKSMGTNRQELLRLHELSAVCLKEKNPEKTCKEKLSKMYPIGKTMSARA